MRSDKKIKILIADDHVVVREGLVSILNRQSDMIVVAEADTGIQAVKLWRERRPDITLTDLRMPLMDGVSVIEAIRGIDATARILILTTYDADEDIYRGLRAGAKAYLLKDMTREELLRYIRMVHAGQTCIPPEVAAKLASQMSEQRLTDRELQILKLMANGASNKGIARTMTISEGTVKTHVKSIFEKLDAKSRTEAVSVAAKRGLIKL